LAAGFNEDEFVNEIWTNSASQVQNEVIMETNDNAEIPDEDVEQEEHEEEEEQDQRPVRNKKDKLCATGGHSLHWRKWLPRRKWFMFLFLMNKIISVFKLINQIYHYYH